MERKLRKHQDILFITGWGVLVLSLWSILRTIIFAVLDREQFFVIEGITENDYSSFKAVMIIFSIILAIDLLFRIYVFRMARADARNQKKKSGGLYIVLTCWFIVMSACSIGYYLKPSNALLSIGNTIVSLSFELTSLATYIELIYSAAKVKKLRIAIKEREN